MSRLNCCWTSELVVMCTTEGALLSKTSIVLCSSWRNLLSSLVPGLVTK